MATSPEKPFNSDAQIAAWRQYLEQHRAITAVDADELEDHLRADMERLQQGGLSADEAFLIASKRLGKLDSVAREYAEVHSRRLWQHLVYSQPEQGHGWYRELFVVLVLAIAAAIAIKLPDLTGWVPYNDNYADLFYPQNLALFGLPFIGAYFVIKRQLGLHGWLLLSGASLLLSLAVNAYPFVDYADTLMLSAIHLPIALWFVIGMCYTGNFWQSQSRRMDFIRFSGEFAIYYVLIALGGGVLTAVTIGLFSFIGFDIDVLVATWILPCGAMGALVIAAYLVEAKQSLLESMAPVLTRVFTPLFVIVLVTLIITMLLTGQSFALEREVLIGLDILLVVVLGLLLYGVSSRDPHRAPGLFDALQWLLVSAALLLDLIALMAISGRLFEFGFSANRVAALGENLILLFSLSGYAWHYWHFLRRKQGFNALEQWQTAMIPVYVVWALVVVIVLPPLFSFS